MKDEMMLWGVTLGRRHTRKQKNLFLDEVMKQMNDKGISCKVFEKKSSIMQIRHLIVNNPAAAKVVIAAAYDTPETAVLKGYKWYPFSMDKNRRQDRINIILSALLAMLCWIPAALLILNMNKAAMLLKVLYMIAALILIYTGHVFLKGRSNQSNFSMNTAAAAAVIKLAEEFGRNSDTAFILLDESASSLQGAKILKEKVPDNVPILFVGNIAGGSQHMLVYGADAEINDINAIDKNDTLNLNRKELSEKQLTQCTLGEYPRSAMLIYGERIGNDFVLPNAKHSSDYNVDMKTLDASVEILKEYIIMKRGKNG